MSDLLDNPSSVVWSHSNRQSDFYELPTDGAEIHSILGWLLQHYEEVKLWMGLETEEGAELYITCSPSRREAVVNRLNVVVDSEFSIFDQPSMAAASGE